MNATTAVWQLALANVITDVQELCAELALAPNLFNSQQANQLFSLRVPRSFVARMQKGNPHDPLLLQVMPIGAELLTVPGYVADPLQEKSVNPVPGLLHKYSGRVLLLIAGACAINCRYCFRREFPYAENAPGAVGWERVLTYIAKDASITEVIFSGGDPLLAKDKFLAKISSKIAEIPHVTTLRIHTRLPIVIPERITSELINWFTTTRLKPVLVIHCNHANEINAEVMQSIKKLQSAGVTVLNQSVLLKDINDNADALVHLSQKLFTMGVLPYYLHALDPTQGAAHFAVSREKAQSLMQEITAQLPGYLVPKYVYEQAGASSKLAR